MGKLSKFFGKKETNERELKPLYVGLVFHAEKIQNYSVFELLCRFGEEIAYPLNIRPILCVMTPFNPLIDKEMKKLGISKDDFISRLKELSRWFDIGYHGHWFKEDFLNEVLNYKKSFSEDYISVLSDYNLTPAVYDNEIIYRQFEKEFKFLKKIGLSPRVYCAGWWFLSDTIIKLLDQYDFLVSCSIRHFHVHTFGGNYLKEDQFPARGYVFRYPQSTKVIEIQSAFYFSERKTRKIKKWLKPILRRRRRYHSLFLTFPLHDLDLTENWNSIKQNLKLLRDMKGIQWSRVIDMAKVAVEEGIVRNLTI